MTPRRSEGYDPVSRFDANCVGEALVCRSCGAVVYTISLDQHDGWHAQIRAELDRLRSA